MFLFGLDPVNNKITPLLNEDHLLSLTVGTQLYELYLALQQFYTLGFTVIKKSKENQDIL